MGSSDLRGRYNDLLLERIRSSRYPSKELMDRYERDLADREHATEYVDVLMERITQYPSIQLLDRLSGLISRIEWADRAAEQRAGNGSGGE
jgi:hypothetical protein